MTMQRASLDLSIMPLVVRLSIRLTGTDLYLSSRVVDLGDCP